MVAVAAEVLGWEFPVAGNEPLLYTAKHLGASLPPIPAVPRQVQEQRKIPKVFQEGRGRGIPGGPAGPLVVAQLGDLHQPPLRLVQLRMVRLFVEGHPHQLAIGGVAPPVVWTGEDGSVALVTAAHLHAPVPAGIEEHMQRVLTVPAEDDGLFSHAGDEVIARLLDLALMANEQPGPGEYLRLLLLIDLCADKDVSVVAAS